MCLDSTFLIQFLRGNKKAEKLYDSLNQENYLFYTTSVNIYEIFYGYFYTHNKKDKSKQNFDQLKNFLSLINVESLESTSAIRASSIRVELQSKGMDIGINDTLISAIALEHGGIVVTENKDHFSKVEGISVISHE